MKSRMIYEKTCAVCHQKFLSHSALAMYCPSCKKLVLREQAKESLKRVQARANVQKHIEVKKKAKNKEDLRHMVIEAEKHGLTYGQYVASVEVFNDLH